MPPLPAPPPVPPVPPIPPVLLELELLAPPSPPPLLLALAEEEEVEAPVFGSELQPCPAKEMPTNPAVKRSAQPIRLFVVHIGMNPRYGEAKPPSMATT